MSMLIDHFQKIHGFHERGLPVTHGLYLDVGGTLVRGPELQQHVWDFAVWNHENKFLGPNIVFSGDVIDSGNMLKIAGANLADIGVTEIAPKQRIYNDAFSRQHAFNLAALHKTEDKAAFQGIPAHCLELVIDDSPPLEDGIKGCGMVVSSWHPHSVNVRDFLKGRGYAGFTP